MIRISTKGRYGTRLMVNLARRYGSAKEAVVLKDISEEEGISIRYLEQIIIPLKVNRLVKSIRGTGGGYTLARDPGSIKLSEIIEALEGNCCLVECLEDESFCDRLPQCPTYPVWKRANNILRTFFDSVSLKDIVDGTPKKTTNRKSR
jgi:Rrf2 family protein